MGLSIRPAVSDDAALLHRFIRGLADYEREPDAVQLTVEDLHQQLQQPAPPFEALIAELEGQPCGFALFFHNYSTWRGRRGIYLEDLFVLPENRGRGVGKALLVALARLAVARGCARFEWAVLDWNQPAIDFYRSLGATPLDEWTIFRISDVALERLAATDSG